MPRLDPPVRISEGEIEEALKEQANFGYSGDRDLFGTWALGPIIRTRDSDLLEESNANALIRHLEGDPTLVEDWEVTGANHWAVGWVDHLSFRAIDENGAATRIFRVLKDWFRRLDEYPIADDDDFALREYEAALDAIEEVGGRLIDSSVAQPEWPSECYEWLAENRPRAIESRDGHGAYPSTEDLVTCLSALGWLAADVEAM
jgi:hypothetical protein